MRLLRSRGLAATLLVGLTLYAWVSTFVPLTSVDPEGARAWDAAHPVLAVFSGALGLHEAFTSPLFLLAAALVAASTAACAWERATLAYRYWVGSSSISEGQRASLAASPDMALDIEDPSSGTSVLGVVAESLKGLGMRVREHEGVVIATRGAVGLAGSALFHWAIVGLVLFAAAGQLTRYEGYANVVVGESFRDAREAYDVEFVAGPWFGDGFSGLEFAVDEVDLGLVVDGVERGATPRVTVLDAEAELKTQWVYPNNPVHEGSLVIHRASVNPAFVGTIRTDDAAAGQPVVLYFDFADREPQSFRLPEEISMGDVTVSIEPLGGEQIEVVVVDGAATESTIVGVGGQVQLAENINLEIDDLTYFAQLHVVNDWSVPWIYAMFGLLCLGSALTVFVPTRTVRVIVVEDEGAAKLHVSYSGRKSDPAFPRQLKESLALATGEQRTDGEGS